LSVTMAAVARLPSRSFSIVMAVVALWTRQVLTMVAVIVRPLLGCVLVTATVLMRLLAMFLGDFHCLSDPGVDSNCA
jgi:hypothetical protein